METSHHEVALANAPAELRRIKGHVGATFISIESYLAWMPDVELIRIFHAVGHLPHLVTFRISFSFQRFRQLPVLPIPSQALVAMLQPAQRLETMTLDEVRFVFRGEHDVHALSRALQQAPNLRNVTLFNCFPVPMVEPQNNGTITAATSTTSTRPEEALQNICPDILAHALARIPSLQELNLIFTLQGPEWICALLKQACSSKSMKILRINVPDGSFLGDPIQYMCRSLETNTTLKELSIRCPLDDHGGRALARALQSPHTALEELYIQMRSYQYAIPIAEALQNNNKQLKSFELRVWTGGDRAPLLEAYEAMIKHNTVIERLVIDNGRLGLTPLIDFYLGLNRAGRRALLEEGDKLQKSAWIDFMIRFHPNVSVLFYTLSLNPSLCSSEKNETEMSSSAAVESTGTVCLPMDDDNNGDMEMSEGPNQKRQKVQDRHGFSGSNCMHGYR